MIIEESGAGSVSVPRTKNIRILRIRIRLWIRNTAARARHKTRASLKSLRIGRKVLLQLFGHGPEPVEGLLPAGQVLLVQQLVAVADPAVPRRGGRTGFVAAFSSLAPPLLQTGGVLAQYVAQVDEFLFEGGELAQRVLPSKKYKF